jgi:fatty-acid desaturase
MILNTSIKFKILHSTTHLLSLFGAIWVLMTGNYQWLIPSLIMFLYAGIFGINISLHRYYSHRSFKTGKLRDLFLLFSSFFPMVGSPAMWSSLHVYHHIHSDTDKDPHSPNRSNKFKIWFALWPPVNIPLSIFRRFVKDKKMMFLHKHYFLLIACYALLLLAIDWRLLVFVFAIPAVGCFHGASAIAVIPHLTLWGSYRTHNTNDSSRNSIIAWIFSLGEGWHNNHHNSPRNYRSGEKWWEIDHSAFIIKHFFKTDK